MKVTITLFFMCSISEWTPAEDSDVEFVDTIRMMDPTLPKGASPRAPNGYTKSENSSGQGVNPYMGKTGSKADTHFPID